MQKESGDDAEEDGEEGCAPAQARPLLQRLGRDRGSCDCWLLGGNPLLFELDIVRSLVTLFGIFLQAGPDDVIE